MMRERASESGEVREHVMITCRELAEFLDDYVAGALAAERRAVFEEHLVVCPDCRNFLGSYRRTIGMVKCAGEAVPRDVPAELVRAVLAARDEGKGRD
jgi:predicted anti-sigma-YlaC factor YlaD